jgi:hypothetical protein
MTTVILVVAGAVVALVAILAIVKANAPQPRSTFDRLLSAAPAFIPLFL